MSEIVCVSRGSLSRGRELAVALAQKLGYAALGREDLIEAATREGIEVGRLERSMMNARTLTERFARERDHYLAFSTAYLCERFREGPLVYHGRTGHLLLRDVGHVLRIRVVADERYRVGAAMRSLGVDRAAARRYVASVEEERRNWVRSMYGTEWDDAVQYDVTVNVERLDVDHAASALVAMTHLPEFRMTEESTLAMEDLLLAARARLRLARDARTAGARFTAVAHARALTVLVAPRDAVAESEVRRALSDLDASDVRVTMASTRILWVQESFDPASDAFREVVEVAVKWNAAVELVRYEPDGAGDDGGLRAALEELARVGRSGGGRSVHGDPARLVVACRETGDHALVVLGEVFGASTPDVRLRMTADLREALAERRRAPVVAAAELSSRYFFGRRDLVRLVASLSLVVVVYVLVLTHQDEVLGFSQGDWSGGGALARLVAAVALFVVVPVVALSYGSVARSFMKLIRME